MEKAEAVMLLLMAVAVFVVSGTAEAGSFTLVVENKCKFAVWPAVFPSVEGLPRDLKLNPGQSKSAEIVETSAMEETTWIVWGRTNCAFDNSREALCDTGDCKSDGCPYGVPSIGPINMAFFDFGPRLVSIYASQGFNLPMSVSSTNSSLRCETEVGRCPASLVVDNKQRQPVACSPAVNGTLYKQIMTALCPPASATSPKKSVLVDSAVYRLSFCA